MPVALDILIALTVLFFALTGYKNGAVKSILGVLSLAVSYFAAVALSPRLAGFIEKLNIVDLFSKSMGDALNKGDATLPGLADAGGRFVDEFTSLTGTGGLLDAALNATNALYSRQVTIVIAFVIIFLLTAAAAKIAINIIGIAAKLPLVGSVNRYFGLLFGVAEGVLACFAVCILVSLLAGFTGGALGIAEAVPQTTVYRWFHAHNPLTAFVPWRP